jgi:hypothetical protein
VSVQSVLQFLRRIGIPTEMKAWHATSNECFACPGSGPSVKLGVGCVSVRERGCLARGAVGMNPSERVAAQSTSLLSTHSTY